MLDSESSEAFTVFEDGSGIALLKSDYSSVVLVTSAIEKEFPTLHRLLSSDEPIRCKIKSELLAQGFFSVDYSY